jgi:hypothetical protein
MNQIDTVIFGLLLLGTRLLTGWLRQCRTIQNSSEQRKQKHHNDASVRFFLYDFVYSQFLTGKAVNTRF